MVRAGLTSREVYPAAVLERADLERAVRVGVLRAVPMEGPTEASRGAVFQAVGDLAVSLAEASLAEAVLAAGDPSASRVVASQVEAVP